MMFYILYFFNICQESICRTCEQNKKFDCTKSTGIYFFCSLAVSDQLLHLGM